MNAKENRLFFVFDVESVGLHGEGYACGYVVVDSNGNELECGAAACDPWRAKGDAEGREWIEKNSPKLIENKLTPSDVRGWFQVAWISWKAKGAIMAADCPWPVEARFLHACNLGWYGPYPLIDVASVVLAAGGDPVGTFERRSNELPKHDPLADARQSARILIEHLSKE